MATVAPGVTSPAAGGLARDGPRRRVVARSSDPSRPGGAGWLEPVSFPAGRTAGPVTPPGGPDGRARNAPAAHMASSMATMPIPMDSRHARASSGRSPQRTAAGPPAGTAEGTRRAPVTST